MNASKNFLQKFSRNPFTNYCKDSSKHSRNICLNSYKDSTRNYSKKESRNCSTPPKVFPRNTYGNSSRIAHNFLRISPLMHPLMFLKFLQGFQQEFYKYPCRIYFKKKSYYFYSKSFSNSSINSFRSSYRNS